MWISNSPVADVFVIWAKSDAHEATETETQNNLLENYKNTKLSAPAQISLRDDTPNNSIDDTTQLKTTVLLTPKLLWVKE